MSGEVDPWLAGKAKLAAAKAEAASDRRADRERRDRERRAKRDAARDRRRAMLARWVPQVPWLVIMGAPMALSWSAMVAFGVSLYGPIGVLLPLFADASLVVFALARAAAVERGEPTATLTLGVISSAAVAGALAFGHGIEHGVIAGVAMAVVAVGGAAVHQLVHAKPTSPRRRSGRVRRDRIARATDRRAARVARAAVRAAVPVVGADGSVRLVHQSGPVSVTRTRWGRTRVVPAPDPSPGDRLADEISVWLAAGSPDLSAPLPGPAHPTAPADEPGPDTTQDPTPADTAPASPAPQDPTDHEDEPLIRRVLSAHAAGDLRLTIDAVRKHLRVRKDRAARIARSARDRLRDDDPGGPVAARA